MTELQHDIIKVKNYLEAATETESTQYLEVSMGLYNLLEILKAWS